MPDEVEQLKAQVAALEQLLEVYEQETIEKSSRLEQTLADLHRHTQRLTHAESTLATLRSMLNSVGDGVIVTDQQGNFLFLNPAAEKFLGIDVTCSSLQSWAKTWSVYLPDQVTLHPLDTFPLVRTLQGETLDATEVFVQIATGSEGSWFSVTARSLINPEGTIEGGIAVFHNITNLKQSEMALRQSETHSRAQAQQLQQALHNLQRVQTQLVQTEKMSSLGQLVAGIAHEINNPINFIYGNLVYLQNNALDLLEFIQVFQAHYPTPAAAVQAKATTIDLNFLVEDIPRMIGSMRMGTERIRQIVLSLRNFSRTDEADIKSVDIHEGIESTLLILQHRLNAKPGQSAIMVDRAYGNLPQVECFPGLLNQVFMNVLANTIDALEANHFKPTEVPQITIRTAAIEAETIEVAIADNGIGIPDHLLDRIFDPFFTTKPVGKGTGMGLSISYQIITEKHGGQIKCFSTVGQGTEFVIQIPIRQRSSRLGKRP